MKSRRKKFTTMYGGKKPKLGSGGRFAAMKARLKARGVKEPAALAAAIGRKKYGAKKMAKMSAAGRRRKANAY